ncbi:MAG: hypothetical protein KME47_25870 [Nodosilinea sp. WJT8-NPBG4]|jgi:hypothetical protein|nr:hypothetical protein [Nodosilinea sp. WJT8-NPBG4]
MIISNDEKGFPSKWIDYQAQMKASSANFCGLLGLGSDPGNINRFAARFRVANCFKKLELEGYSSNTEIGYSSLCHVFLAWSAFETLLDLKDTKVSSIENSLKTYRADNSLLQIKTLDVGNKFYNFIHDRVNPTHQKELDKYFQSDPCNIAYLASAIRHIFAHGWLTPNANEVDPKIVAEICRILCEFLVEVMDSEFTLHYEKAMQELRGDQE